MKSYVIHLIRHGLSEGNLKGQYIGSTDSPLSEQGAKEIRRLKKSGRYPAAQRYYSSPLSRCTQTLSILYPKAQPILIDGFSESSFGDWEIRLFRIGCAAKRRRSPAAKTAAILWRASARRLKRSLRT